MILKIYTLVHVVISLVAIWAGLVVFFGWLNGKRLNGWTALFLWTTVATTVTGFFFPFRGFSPAFATGIFSTITLTFALLALYRYKLAGTWRSIFVVNAAISLYLNVFVLIVQSFLKIPVLNALAPTQTEAPFKVAQLVTLAVFIWLTVVARKKFLAEPVPAT